MLCSVAKKRRDFGSSLLYSPHPQWSLAYSMLYSFIQSCPTHCDSINGRLQAPLWDFPGQNPGVGSYAFLQEISPKQGSNPGILLCRWILYHLSHQGKPPRLHSNAFKYQWDITSHLSEQLSPKSLQINIGKDVVKENTCALLVGGKFVQLLWKTVRGILKKLKIVLPYNPALWVLSIHPDKTKC